MTSEQLAAIVGVVLSLAFSYVPGVNDWFEGLASAYKRAVMGGLLVAAAVAIFALACGNFEVGVTCSEAGAIEFVKVLIAALVANQSVYPITKKG